LRRKDNILNKNTVKELKDYTEIAFNILQGETNYNRSKKIISDVFKINRKDRYETILFRLTIIDSYYSTQMNKRFFGLDDLSEKLTDITIDDDELKNISLNYIEGKYNGNKIEDLFNEKYGIRKTGYIVGQAASLISKYLYFLTEYNFPIYDNLVKSSYKLIIKKYSQLNLIGMKCNFDFTYFELLNSLNVKAEIKDFNKLDNLLWLIGKLTEGSLSLILSKNNYLNLLKNIHIEKGVKSKDVDIVIRKFIRKNIDNLTDIFEENEIKFLKYTYALMDVEK